MIESEWYKLYSGIKRGGGLTLSKETSFIKEHGKFDNGLDDRYKYEYSGKTTIEANELNEFVNDENEDSVDSQYQNNPEGVSGEPSENPVNQEVPNRKCKMYVALHKKSKKTRLSI